MSKLVNKEIYILKSEIQNLLNKISNSEILIEIEHLNNTKDCKLKELKVLNDKYKILLKEENEHKKEIEYKKIVSKTDSLTFSRVKNNPNRNEIMSTLKKNREKADAEFYTFKKLKEEYSKIDSKKIPGFLFLNEIIINLYGICPYIKIENSLDIEIKRKKWLENTIDKGEKYYELYDKIINESELLNNTTIKNNLEISLENICNNIMNNYQLKTLNCSIEYLIEYINCNVKTKKIKDKFKIIINNLSSLVIETGLPINQYISLKYDIYIPINELQELNNTLNISNKDNLIINKFIIDDYMDKIIKYKKVKDDIINNKKYITNVKKNLKQELYEYLSKYKHQIEYQTDNNNYKNKKWSQLTIDDKNNRFESFSKYYVSKFLISSNLLSLDKKEDTINILNNLLKNSNLKYKELKWDVKLGCIISINNLKWNDELKTISLKVNNPELIIKDKQNTDNINNKVNLSIKKNISIKTILNKNNEEIINEEILKFLIQKMQKNNLFNLQECKNILLENLKIKLLLKRITINDKIKIFKKIDDVYNIISQN